MRALLANNETIWTSSKRYIAIVGAANKIVI